MKKYSTATFVDYYAAVEDALYELFGGYIPMEDYFNAHRWCDASLEDAIMDGFDMGFEAEQTAADWYTNASWSGTRRQSKLMAKPKSKPKPRAVNPITAAREARRQAWRNAKLPALV
jgi:hypothetical protein